VFPLDDRPKLAHWRIKRGGTADRWNIKSRHSSTIAPRGFSHKHPHPHPTHATWRQRGCRSARALGTSTPTARSRPRRRRVPSRPIQPFRFPHSPSSTSSSFSSSLLLLFLLRPPQTSRLRPPASRLPPPCSHLASSPASHLSVREAGASPPPPPRHPRSPLPPPAQRAVSSPRQLSSSSSAAAAASGAASAAAIPCANGRERSPIAPNPPPPAPPAPCAAHLHRIKENVSSSQQLSVTAAKAIPALRQLRVFCRAWCDSRARPGGGGVWPAGGLMQGRGRGRGRECPARPRFVCGGGLRKGPTRPHGGQGPTRPHGGQGEGLVPPHER